MNERIGIVVSEFNSSITNVMLETALDHAKSLGARIVKTIKVAGSFDIPLGVKKLLEMKEIEGVVTLGAVIEGGTDHDGVIAYTAAKKIADLSLQYDKPVSLGISGPKMTKEEATKRAQPYAKRAVEATLKMMKELK